MDNRMTGKQKRYMDWFRLPYFPYNHSTPTTREQADRIIRAAQERAGFFGDEAKEAQMARYKVDLGRIRMSRSRIS
jgi:hypothetical protein